MCNRCTVFLGRLVNVAVLDKQTDVSEDKPTTCQALTHLPSTLLTYQIMWKMLMWSGIPVDCQEQESKGQKKVADTTAQVATHHFLKMKPHLWKLLLIIS